MDWNKELMEAVNTYRALKTTGLISVDVESSVGR